MGSAIALKTRERKTLLHYYRRHPDPALRLRAHIVLMLADGHPWSLITTTRYCSTRTIDRWMRRFEDGGIDALLGLQCGRQRRWSDEAEAIMKDAMKHSPDELGYREVNWTVPLLRDHVEKIWGERPSRRQVREKLYEWNYVWKRPRHDLPESKSPRVKRRLRRIREKVRRLPEDCATLFADETDLLLFPPLRAGWFLRGKPAVVPISGENAKRTIFGTIDVDTGRRVLTARDGACATDFQAILRMIRQEYKGQEVALLLDGASRHTAYESKDFAAELDIKFIWLPSRCANINPMDRLWRWGKNKICANKQYFSIDYQAKAFIDYLRSLSPEEALRKAGILSGNFWLFRQ
jgi:putative transposase